MVESVPAIGEIESKYTIDGKISSKFSEFNEIFYRILSKRMLTCFAALAMMKI